MESSTSMATEVKNKVTRTKGGMPGWAILGVGRADGKWVTYWPYKSEIDGKRFLTRFILFRSPLFSIDITRIHMSDDQRAYPHDHSRSFASFKFGSYEEWVYYEPEDLTQRRFRKHSKFSTHLLRFNQAHSITRVSPGLVTILFLGPRHQKSNYWTPTGFQSIGMKVDQDVWE